MSEEEKQIIVVGAGVGGLSAAIRLAASGYQVQVLERQPTIGGKLNQVVVDGFHFDTGPSLITMPFVLRELFCAAGRRLEDYLQLQPLDPTCRYFYRDGVVLNAWRDHERLAAEFARLNLFDGEALAHFMSYAGQLYNAAADPFLFHSLGSPLDLLRAFARYVLRGQTEQVVAGGAEPPARSVGERFKIVLEALAPTTLDQCIRRFFEDPHLRQLFARYATYNGSSPYQLASVYSIIPYVELAGGGWYLSGGIYTLAEALGRLARELGVQIETDCEVRRILVTRGRARGVVLADGRVLRSAVVVANSDVVTTHRQLLAPEARQQRETHRLERLEPSGSGFVIMLGTARKYPQLAHHNIFFSDNYQAEFEDLFTHRLPASQPTIYICASSRSDPTQAPSGQENLFILVNAPYLTSQVNWRREAGPYRTRILELLADYPEAGLEDLQEQIISEVVLTPEDFWQKYGANRGSIYGLSSNQRLSPFTRPGNRARDIRGLYFVGGSTHPGGGLPLVMLSGKIVSELVSEDRKKRFTP